MGAAPASRISSRAHLSTSSRFTPTSQRPSSVCRIVATRAPVYSAGTVYWDGDDEDFRHFESGCFPLSEDGETVNIVLMELLVYWPGDDRPA